MDKLKKHQSELASYSFFWIVVSSLLSVGTYLLLASVFKLDRNVSLGVTVLISLMLSFAAAKLVVLAGSQPLKALWQAIWHISPSGGDIPAPDIEKMTHGRELADDLIQQIYGIASNSQAIVKVTPEAMPVALAVPAPVQTIPTEPAPAAPADTTALIDLIPLPVIALDSAGNIIKVNKLFSDYTGLPFADLVGRSFANSLPMQLPGNQTLQGWLDSVKDTSVTADISWDRVRLQLADDAKIKQFDMIGHFSKDNPAGYETLLAIFDHTERYGIEDSSTSYVALAVHELRTPLTVLRGYIEVVDEELSDKLTPELKEFMSKMSASAQTLTAFVSNILNVARIDENQLSLSLQEANWNEMLPEICQGLELRAKVRGKSLQLDIAPNLPTLAVDKISIYEVVSNLVENAIKYSGESDKIIIHAKLANDGNVQTVVQDFGLGIPEGSVKHLFTKFYRSHRSKSQVGGTGLGLYLVKAIVTAHGGEVWVQTKEGEGSSFGFSLKPYASVAEELKSSGGGIERHAHGWIKNHSMTRK